MRREFLLRQYQQHKAWVYNKKEGALSHAYIQCSLCTSWVLLSSAFQPGCLRNYIHVDEWHASPHRHCECQSTHGLHKVVFHQQHWKLQCLTIVCSKCVAVLNRDSQNSIYGEELPDTLITCQSTIRVNTIEATQWHKIDLTSRLLSS